MLTKVTVNGVAYIVDAPTLKAAEAYGRTKIDNSIQAVVATAADLSGVDFSAVEVLPAGARRGRKPKDEAAAEGGI